jgi:ABC-type transporter Mla MlaB component
VIATSERPPAAAGLSVLALRGPVERADLHGIRGRVALLLAAGVTGPLVVDVAALAAPDAAAIEALVCAQLSARRCGSDVLLRHPSRELLDLLAFAGLETVLRCEDELLGRRRRKAEQREQPGRVEEGVEPGDPPA